MNVFGGVVVFCGVAFAAFFFALVPFFWQTVLGEKSDQEDPAGLDAPFGSRTPMLASPDMSINRAVSSPSPRTGAPTLSVPAAFRTPHASPRASQPLSWFPRTVTSPVPVSGAASSLNPAQHSSYTSLADPLARTPSRSSGGALSFEHDKTISLSPESPAAASSITDSPVAQTRGDTPRIGARRQSMRTPRAGALLKSETSERMTSFRNIRVEKDTAVLTAADLEHHVHRIYFAGNNTPDSPLCLPPTITTPDTMLQLIKREEYSIFATLCRSLTEWRWWETLIYRVLRVIMPPGVGWWTDRVRKRKMTSLKQFVNHDYDNSFMRSSRARSLMGSLVCGSSQDCSLAYIDVIDNPKKLPSQVQSAPAAAAPPAASVSAAQRFPLSVMFAGEGVFTAPLQLDNTDLLTSFVGSAILRGEGTESARSAKRDAPHPAIETLSAFPLLDSAQETEMESLWSSFVASLNTHLRRLDVNSLSMTLSPLLNFVFISNKQHFERLGCQVSLGAFLPDASGVPTKLGLIINHKDAPLRLSYDGEVISSIDSDPCVKMNPKQRRAVGSVSHQLWTIALPTHSPHMRADLASLLSLVVVHLDLVASVFVLAMCYHADWQLFTVMLLLPPLGFTAPLYGLFSIILGSPKWQRWFCLWNSYALFPVLLMLVGFAFTGDSLSTGLWALFLFLWLTAKIAANHTVSLAIAAVEVQDPSATLLGAADLRAFIAQPYSY
eukprot:TRINITY_DN5715_c0_g1_i1.p1 TRINITY_DN5715_c0_g1~~TRINITY_DN5715_c0_g1_i1.p1  ORF type:complete len:835 (-),score=169.75 TRINITY_DN5715_c0_g1_i1:56-2221(-)